MIDKILINHHKRHVAYRAYIAVFHIVALFGIMYAMINKLHNSNAYNTGEPYIQWAESLPKKLLFPLPEGTPKVPSNLKCRDVFIRNTLICKLWFTPAGLYALKLVPPGSSTAWRFDTTNKDPSGWTVTVDTYGDDNSPWNSLLFPALTVRDNACVGIPDVAIAWRGTKVSQTYQGKEVWSLLADPEFLDIQSNGNGN